MLIFYRISVTLYIDLDLFCIVLETTLTMSNDAVNSICQCRTKKKSNYPTCFEWIQILVTFSVHVAIALYTFVQNNNDQTIALANREKDLEIARCQRIQDLQITADQQRANILAAYESFLVDHLNKYGMDLGENSSARFVVRMRTLTTVSQLDPTRKSCIIQSLFEAKLIVNNHTTANPYSPSIISLEEADLSEISFQNRALKHLSLPRSNLTRAVFAFVDLSYANFDDAILTNASFHGASILAVKSVYFSNTLYAVFVRAKMTGTILSQAVFIATNFNEAILEYAIMHHFGCLACLFVDTNMYHADLTFATIYLNSVFERTNLTKSILLSAKFTSTIFNYTTFFQIQATKVNFDGCSFKWMNLSSSVLQSASIVLSNFSNVHFVDVDLTKSIFTNVNFTNVSMSSTNLHNTIFNQCQFIDVNFTGAIVRNTSFLNCLFQRSPLSNEQRLQVASFNGTLFS